MWVGVSDVFLFRGEKRKAEFMGGITWYFGGGCNSCIAGYYLGMFDLEMMLVAKC